MARVYATVRRKPIGEVRRTLEWMRRFLLLLAAVALFAPADALADNPRLTATVGPGFGITLADANGQPVRQLDPGAYDITVRDLSGEHNFHLYGPGVDQTTSVAGTGTVSWTVMFREGRYTFVCDPHSDAMRGGFVVGNPPPPPPPPAPAPTRLVATVGPGSTITLRTPAGAPVRRLKAGVFAITVRDRTRLHNFHLVGVGVNRKTTVAGRGTVTWRVTLRKGALRYFSDRAPRILRGVVTVT